MSVASASWPSPRREFLAESLTLGTTAGAIVSMGRYRWLETLGPWAKPNSQVTPILPKDLVSRHQQGNFSKMLDIKLIIENSSKTTGVDHLIKWFTDKWRTPGTIRCMDKVVITTQASATSRRARSSLLVRDTKDISAIRETTGQVLKQPPSTETKNNSVARLHRWSLLSKTEILAAGLWVRQA